MNIILKNVPENFYSIFLNSGDTINGNLELNNFKSQRDFFLINTYKKEYDQKNVIKIKNTYLDGMPFSHQSLIFKKRLE